MNKNQGNATLLVLVVTGILTSSLLFLWQHGSLLDDLVCQQEQWHRNFVLTDTALMQICQKLEQTFDDVQTSTAPQRWGGVDPVNDQLAPAAELGQILAAPVSTDASAAPARAELYWLARRVDKQTIYVQVCLKQGTLTRMTICCLLGRPRVQLPSTTPATQAAGRAPCALTYYTVRAGV